jgi:uncharacterized protein (DUF58 family)
VRAARWGLAAAAVALAALAVLSVLPLGSDDPATIGGDGPAATSRLFAAAADGREASVVTSTPLALRGDPAIDPERTLLVVLGATRAYTAEEARALQEFLEDGGRAIVAEDGGLAGTLLGPFGLAFERVPILHADGDTPIDAGGAELRARLPSPVLVQPGSPAAATLLTSRDAFVDRDNDGTFSRADPAGPFIVAARAEVGSQGGVLVALGSLDLLSDRLADDPAVAAWRAALLAELAPPGTAVVLDESHRGHAAPAGTAAWVVRATSQTPFRWANLAAAALAAAALLLLARHIRPWGPHVHVPDRFRSRREARDGLARAAHDPEADGPARAGWTPRGKLAGAAAVVLLLGGAVLRSGPAVCAGLVLAAPMLAAVLAPRPAATVTRSVPVDRVPEGQAVPVEVRVRSGRAADVEVRDGVPPEDAIAGPGPWRRLAVRRGQETVLAYEVRPELRGLHRLGPLRLRTSDPLRLHVSDVPAGPAAEVKVLPRRDTLKRVKLPVRRPDILMGAHSVNRAGEGSEFHALREYQAGDALRTVNWKASARSKTLMVNQRVLESQTILTLVLDARAVSDCGPANGTPLARAARALLTIAAAGAQGRDRVRVVLYGADMTDLPPAPSQRFLHELANHLASLPATGDMGFSAVAARLVPTVRPGTPVALFSGLESAGDGRDGGDGGFAAGARALIARGASLTVFAFPIATEGAHGESDPGGPAIHERRRKTIEALRGTGAVVHEIRPDMPLEVMLRLQGVGR